MKRCFRTIELLCGLLVISGGDLRAQAAPRLVGWWTMDEALESTTLTDSSGNGWQATLGTGTTIVEDGRFGRAARFDGSTNAWARFFSNTRLTNFTLSAWFNVNPSYTNTLFPKLFQLNTLYYQFNYTTPGRFNIGLGSVPTRAEWSTPDQDPFKFTTNRWTHGALVVRRFYTNETDWVAQPTFYMNGVRCGTDVQVSKTFAPDTIGAGYGFLGNTANGGARALDGKLDDVRIYDGALTDREVLAVYQNCPVAVHAGAGQTVYRDASLLQGRLASTNSFSRQIAATSLWSVVSAPAGAAPVIQHPDIPVTAVTLPEAGSYVFRLTAYSDLGVFSSEVEVIRLADPPVGNGSPSVIASWAATNTVLGASAPLAATVTDDGNPGPVRIRWSKASGPGAVFFDNPFTNATAASFSAAGTYVVRLEADDGAAAGAAEITVTVFQNSANLSEALLHWWRMDDEPTDKKAYDSHGAITVSLNNSALLQPGKTGLGLRTPRLDACGVGSTFPAYATNMTFSFWFYHDEAYVKRASGNVIQRVYNIGPNFYILYNPSTRKFDLSSRGIGTGSTQHTWQWPDIGITSNRWFHAAFLFNGSPAAKGSQQAMYLDGVKVLSNPYNTTNFPGAVDFTTPFLVANNASSGGTRNFDGVLDEMRIYSRFITDEEARLLAADPDNNHAPVIENVPDSMTFKVGHSASLEGVVADDGQPFGGALVTAWSLRSGNSEYARFAEPSDPATFVTFTRAGQYVIMLSASDGEQKTAKLVSVTVRPTGTLFSIR